MVFGFIKHMSNERKQKIRHRLAILYAIIAWNSCAYFMYYNHKERLVKNDLPPGLQYSALTKNVATTKVISMEGFKVVENTFYNKEQIDNARRIIDAGDKIDDTADF